MNFREGDAAVLFVLRLGAYGLDLKTSLCPSKVGPRFPVDSMYAVYLGMLLAFLLAFILAFILAPLPASTALSHLGTGSFLVSSTLEKTGEASSSSPLVYMPPTHQPMHTS